MKVFLTVEGEDAQVEDLLKFLEDDSERVGYMFSVSFEDVDLELDQHDLVDTVNKIREEKAENFSVVDPSRFVPPFLGEKIADEYSQQEEEKAVPTNEERLLAVVSGKLGDLKNLQHLRKGRETFREIRDGLGLLALLYSFELRQKYPEEADEFISHIPSQYRVVMNRLLVPSPEHIVPEDYEREILDDEA